MLQFFCKVLWSKGVHDNHASLVYYVFLYKAKMYSPCTPPCTPLINSVPAHPLFYFMLESRRTFSVAA